MLLIPADRNLTGAEIELVPMPEREHAASLDVCAASARSTPSYRLSSFAWSAHAERAGGGGRRDLPLHCEYFALEGLADLVATIRRVRASLNPSLDIDGVLLTMYDERTNLGQHVARDVREFFKEKVFTTVIPRNVRLGEAPATACRCCSTT